MERHNDTYKNEAFESKTRLLFFDKLAKTEGAIVFFMNKNSSTETQNNNSKIREAIVKGDKFAFSKKPSLKQN